MDLILGIVIGVALALLAQRFLPSKWTKLTRKADEVIDEQIKK